MRFTRSATSTSQIELQSRYIDTPDGSDQPQITRLDGRGLATTWIYDAAYRLAELRRPGYSGGTAHRTQFSYDAGSRPWQIVDGNGSTITQAWDLALRKFERSVAPGSGVSLSATRETVYFDWLGRVDYAGTAGAPDHSSYIGGVDVTFDVPGGSWRSRSPTRVWT